MYFGNVEAFFLLVVAFLLFVALYSKTLEQIDDFFGCSKFFVCYSL